jgi:hypothetical protein
MQKLLLSLSSILLILYSCQSIEKEKKNCIERTVTVYEECKEIDISMCILPLDTLVPNDDLLNDHIPIFADYILDSIPKKMKDGFRAKKYYFSIDVHVEYALIERHGLNAYTKYVNEVVKYMHHPMGKVNGWPVADTYLTYTPTYKDSGDSLSFIKISIRNRAQ